MSGAELAADWVSANERPCDIENCDKVTLCGVCGMCGDHWTRGECYGGV